MLSSGMLVWHGQDPAHPTFWDAQTSTNWLDGAIAQRFFNGDPVVFDDSALRSDVTLIGSLSASLLTLSNDSAAYTFAGAGSLAVSGPAALRGSGSLTLSNSGTATFSSGITMDAGALTVGSPVGPSVLGPVTLNGNCLVTVANNAENTFGPVNLGTSGTLAFNQPTNVTLGAPLAGAGTLVKQGPNTLTLAGNNSAAFTGAIQGNGGVLRVGGVNSLYGSGATIADGATLDVNGISSYLHLPVTVQGNGVGGRGAIDNGSSTYQTYALDNITLAADTTFGATAGGWEVHPSPFWGGTYPGYLIGNGHKLTKVGTYDVWLSVGGDTGLGHIEIKEGVLGFAYDVGSCTMGDPTKTLTVRSNAVLANYGPNIAGEKQIVLDDGAFLAGGSTGGSFGGPAGSVTLNGTNHALFYSSAAVYRCDSPISGPGVLEVGVPINYPVWGGARHLLSGRVEPLCQPSHCDCGRFAPGKQRCPGHKWERHRQYHPDLGQ
jgi:autotransporter-associated beta strand protein